jgi:pimeloyl-ACP methyl ester carboxylesterase
MPGSRRAGTTGSSSARPNGPPNNSSAPTLARGTRRRLSTRAREHDEADHAAGRRIGPPLLFLWAALDDLEDLYGDPLAIWRDWADDVRGQSIDCGHHIAEEAPAELAAQLSEFSTPVGSGSSRAGTVSNPGVPR